MEENLIEISKMFFSIRKVTFEKSGDKQNNILVFMLSEPILNHFYPIMPINAHT